MSALFTMAASYFLPLCSPTFSSSPSSPVPIPFEVSRLPGCISCSPRNTFFMFCCIYLYIPATVIYHVPDTKCWDGGSITLGKFHPRHPDINTKSPLPAGDIFAAPLWQSRKGLANDDKTGTRLNTSSSEILRHGALVLPHPVPGSAPRVTS